MNGTTTEYLTSGGEVVAQKTGSNVITYTRGADGSLISMNRNGVVYYYQTNLQGDVEKILDGSGTAVVSYTYDAYGRITSMTGDQTLGQENPFRYRSYFFDQESGFYYLQSRYYDPMMGRFISADSQINPDVNGGNVFSYCGNNPVNMVDPDGHWPRWVNDLLFNLAMKAIDKLIDYVFDFAETVYPIIDTIQDIREDIDNYDSQNTDEYAVLDSNYFSSYRGVPVLKAPIGQASFSLGIIVLGKDVYSRNTMRHEYGHNVQLDELGMSRYLTSVFIPSITFYQIDRMNKLPYGYYSSPWEYQADQFGGVTGRSYEFWAEPVCYLYSLIQ